VVHGYALGFGGYRIRHFTWVSVIRIGHGQVFVRIPMIGITYLGAEAIETDTETRFLAGRDGHTNIRYELKAMHGHQQVQVSLRQEKLLQHGDIDQALIVHGQDSLARPLRIALSLQTRNKTGPFFAAVDLGLLLAEVDGP